MTFTEIGSLVGFCTGVFTLIDRLMLGRPLASITRQGEGRRALQIANLAKSDVIVTSIKVWGDRIYVAKDDSIKGIAGSVIAMPVAAVLEPTNKIRLPIVIGGGDRLHKGGPRALFLVAIFWRRTRSMWVPQWPVFLLSSVRSLSAIDAAGAEGV